MKRLIVLLPLLLYFITFNGHAYYKPTGIWAAYSKIDKERIQ